MSTLKARFIRGNGLVAHDDFNGKAYYLKNGHGDVVNLMDEIIQEMMIMFQVPYEEAFDRVDQKWDHIESITEEDDMIFHLTPKEWAYEIYFGNSSLWWKKDLSELTPLPYISSKKG